MMKPNDDSVVVQNMRAFLALDLDPFSQDKLLQMVSEWRSVEREFQILRWVAPAQWHITLLFMGDVAPEALLKFCQVVERQYHYWQKPMIEWSHFEWFPSPEKPKALVLALRADPALIAIRDAVADISQQCDIIINPGKKFIPHVTIARGKSRYKLPAVELPSESTHLSELILFRSLPEKRGTAYQKLAHWRLSVSGAENKEKH